MATYLTDATTRLSRRNATRYFVVDALHHISCAGVVPELYRSCTGVVPIQKFRFHIYIPGRTRNFATKDGNWQKSNQVLPYSSKALYIAALTLDDSLTMILSKITTIIVRSRYTRSCFRSKLQARNAQISSAESLFATFSMFCKSSCK